MVVALPIELVDPDHSHDLWSFSLSADVVADWPCGAHPCSRLRRLGMPGAWFAAAVFAVHPMHVDSVVWAIERKDVLSALFYLLSALAYLHWDELRRGVGPARRARGATRRRCRSGRGEALYVGSLAAFTLGLLSKSIVVTLPVVLLVFHWWRDGWTPVTWPTGSSIWQGSG